MPVRTEVARCLELLFERLVCLGEAEVMEALVHHDLPFPQARALFTLASAQPMPINELAARLGQSVAAAGRNVDALVRSGLVERNENPADRRVRLVSVSARGQEVVDQLVVARRQVLSAFADELPDDQSARLLEALRPVVAEFDSTYSPQMKEPHG